MGRHDAEGMDEALSKATYSCPSLLLSGASGRSHSETWSSLSASITLHA
jgi:hypothetical protein